MERTWDALTKPQRRKVVDRFVRDCRCRGVDAVLAGLHPDDLAPLIGSLVTERAPRDILRATLKEGWTGDAQDILRPGGLDRSALLHAFREARFDVSRLPEAFTAWRGAAGDDAEWAVSWTLQRKVAIYFAELRLRRWRSGDLDPLVLRRTVRRDQVLFYDEDLNLAEIVIDGPATDVEIDCRSWDWERDVKEYNVERRRWLLGVLQGPDSPQRRLILRMHTRQFNWGADAVLANTIDANLAELAREKFEYAAMVARHAAEGDAAVGMV